MTLAFTIIRRLVNHALSLYYSDIRVKDAQFVPEGKPVIFLINHNAGLIDMLMMLGKCPRVVNFWAAAFYWENPLLAKICNALKLVPVTRAHEADHKKKLFHWPLKGTSSDATFEYSLEKLKASECVALCPEGETHTGSHMAHFRTGTARMLLMAAHQGLDHVLVQTCGLMYLDRGHARRPVVIEFGKPVSIRDLLNRCDFKGPIPEVCDPVLQKITDQLEHEMTDVTINAEDWPTVRAIKTAAELYQPDHVHLPLETEMEIVQRFANKYELLSKNPKVHEAIEVAKKYNEVLDSLHAHDFHIKTQATESKDFFPRVAHLVWASLWLLPFALIGVPLHSPVYFLMQKVWKAIVSNPKIDTRRLGGVEVKQTYPHFLPGALDLADSMQLAIAAVIVILGYFLSIFGVLLWKGFLWSALWAVSAPSIHALSLQHLSAFIANWRKLRIRFRLYSQRDRLLALKKQRIELQRQARSLVDEFADPELQRIFPKNSF